MRQWAKAKRMDLLNATSHAVLVALQDADVAARVGQWETRRANLEAFSADIPADLGKKVRKACRDAGVRP